MKGVKLFLLLKNMKIDYYELLINEDDDYAFEDQRACQSRWSRTVRLQQENRGSSV